MRRCGSPGRCWNKRRRADHEVDQAFDVVWPLDIDRKIVCPAQMPGRVSPAMIDGCNDKAGVREYFIGVVMTEKLPLLPCETTMSASSVSGSGQSVHPRRVSCRDQPFQAVGRRDTTRLP